VKKTTETAEKKEIGVDELPEERRLAELWQRGWREPEPPAAVEQAILACAAAEANAFRLRRINRPRRWQMAAACVLVGACSLFGLCWNHFFTRPKAKAEAERRVAAEQEAIVEKAVAVAERIRNLPDYAWDDFDDRLLKLENNVTLTRTAGSADFMSNYNF